MSITDLFWYTARMRNLTLKLSLGLALGIIPTIWILQNNHRVIQSTVTPLLAHLEKTWNARITIQKTSVSLFSGIIHLENLTIRSKHDIGCTWSCKKAELHILQSSLKDQRLNLHFVLEENNIETAYRNKTLGLSELLKSMFTFQSKQFNAQSFLIKNITIALTNTSHNSALAFQGTIKIKKDRANQWHGRIMSQNSSLCVANKPIITTIRGITTFDETTDAVQTDVQHTFFSSMLTKNESYMLSGGWGRREKKLSLTNKNKSFTATLTSDTQGLVAEFEATLHGTSVRGTSVRGTAVRGTARWDSTAQTGTITIDNKEQIKLPASIPYLIPANNLHSTITIDTNKKISGTYHITLVHKNTKKKIPVKGTFFVQKPTIITSGTSSLGNYFLSLDMDKKIPLTKCIVTKKGIIVAQITQKNKLCGSIAYQFLQSLFPVPMRKWLLSSRGTIDVSIGEYTQNHLSGTISFKDGKINIPGNYNLITDLSSDFDFFIPSKKLILKNNILGFYKGSVVCDRATIQWDKENNLMFIHGYLQAKNLLINWKNDLFGFIAGNFFVTKQNRSTPTKVCGDVIVKKSLFKESIFSGKASADILQSSIVPLIKKNQALLFDIRVSNEEDLTIQTPFLQTQATVDLRVEGRIVNSIPDTPRMSGRITLRRGKLTFPKNNLFISSGKIDFIPTRLNNPMVNLVAKNRIKKYLIGLTIAGPLQQPTIFLESNPELNEEQIIALLFAGSETISLKANLPSILMHNLNQLILGNKQTLPAAKRFFKKLTAPFQYIQITPNFTDQSGRGGVKGTVSIDVNKQLHAHIQKNFTMQDDLSFKLEYFLSDICNVKAIKDSRGDIGTELELVFRP